MPLISEMQFGIQTYKMILRENLVRKLHSTARSSTVMKHTSVSGGHRWTLGMRAVKTAAVGTAALDEPSTATEEAASSCADLRVAD